MLALHVMTLAALMIWSWRKWPDPIVDFGRELYVPWRIVNGDVLVRDIATLFGPFSPYLNALWFRLFGPSLLTLALCNLGILAATIAGIFHLIRTSTDSATAAAATLTAMLLFACSQYLDVGNYNFITPYSHEATHGLALSVAALVAFCAAATSGRTDMAGVSGFCAGLVLLTKPEIALALGAAILLGWLVVASSGVDGRLARHALAFLICALIPSAAFGLYFHVSGAMPWPDAFRAVAGGWTAALTTPIARNAFYAKVTGLDRPVGHALEMVLISAGILLFVAAAVALAWWEPVRRLERAMSLIARAVFLAAAAFAVPYFDVPRALPIFAMCGLAAAVVTAHRERGLSADSWTHLPLIVWAAFAVAMLAKMFLNARIYHYGFYLALPATTVTVVLLVWFVPKMLSARVPTPVVRRARVLLAAAIAVSIVPHLALSQTWFSTKTVSVGSGSDRFLAGGGPLIWQGEAVAAAVEWIGNRTPADATIAVLPEGVMINYLSRRRTSLRFVNFMPPEMIAFGEAALIQAFREHPPDFVLIVDRSTAEYGYASFGSDRSYGWTTLTWINQHYEAVAAIGRNPASESGRAIVVLKRKR